MVQITKHTNENGEKGKTVLFSPKIWNEESTGKLKIDSFRFYTPLDGLTSDENGHTYYDAPQDEVLIQRDGDYDKEMFIFVKAGQGIQAYSTFLNEQAPGLEITFDKEGDLIAKIYIPTDPQDDIIVDYYERKDG